MCACFCCVFFVFSSFFEFTWLPLPLPFVELLFLLCTLLLFCSLLLYFFVIVIIIHILMIRSSNAGVRGKEAKIFSTCAQQYKVCVCKAKANAATAGSRSRMKMKRPNTVYCARTGHQIHCMEWMSANEKPKRREIATTIITTEAATAEAAAATAAAATTTTPKKNKEKERTKKKWILFINMGTHSLTSLALDAMPSLSLAPKQHQKFLCSIGYCCVYPQGGRERGAHDAHTHTHILYIYFSLHFIIAIIRSFIWSHEMLWKFKYIRLCCLFVRSLF